MTHHSTYALALSLSLLAACSDTGAGSDSESTGSPTEASATGTDGATSSTSSETTATASTADTETPTSTSGDTATDPSDTDVSSTTDEPVLCAEWAVPDPVNEFGPLVFIKHAPKDSRFFIDFYTFGDNYVELLIELGAEAPVVGTSQVAFTGTAYLQAAPSDVEGTATLELVELSDDCFSARFSDIVEAGSNAIVLEQLPGGVLGQRLTLF